MNMKKVLPWIFGGILTVSAVGLGFSATTGYAAEKNSQQTKQIQMHQGMMEQMDAQKMQDMMQEMMKNPEMMKQMMQKPEMQTMMKAMMQKDGQFHKMMSDLVNSVDMDENHDHGQRAAQASVPATSNTDHSQHH